MAAFTVPLLNNGEDFSSATFPVNSPVSRQTLWTCSAASEDDAIATVQAAAAAFLDWSKSRPTTRRAIFIKGADLLEQRAEQLEEQGSQETRASEDYTAFDIATAADELRDIGGRCSAIP